MRNVFFDTCVYHQPGIDLLFDVIDIDNILFGSEMVGAVRGIDPQTGHYFDDTRRYVDALDLTPGDRAKVFEGNARRVYPRLHAALERQDPARRSRLMRDEAVRERRIGWADGTDRCAVPSARPDRRSPRPRPCRRGGPADPVQRVERVDSGRPRRQRCSPVPADGAGQAAGLVGAGAAPDPGLGVDVPNRGGRPCPVRGTTSGTPRRCRRRSSSRSSRSTTGTSPPRSAARSTRWTRRSPSSASSSCAPT